MILRVAVLLLCFGSALALRASEEPKAAAPQAPASAQAADPGIAPETEKGAPPQGETTPAPAQPGDAPHAGSIESAAEPEPELPAQEKQEIERLIKYAQSSADEGRLDMSLIAYKQLLAKHLTRKQERVVILGYARALKKSGDLTKAAAIFEKVIKDYPAMEDVPEIYLELGRTQRALGAYKSAIARFYSVINSTIKLPEDGANRYRQLAKTAQFEIAETHFQAGNFLEASRFYGRLRLLDLAQSDRARAHFKSAYALSLAEDHLGATTVLRSYLDQNPDDENVPEAHYLLAVSYRRLQRPMEALVEALELLRTERTRTAKDPKGWAYWQRKTGNQVANEFYEQGDFANALIIYQTLSELSTESSWRLPIVYQIALCQERLGQMDKAMASYQSILDKLSATKGDGARTEDFADLARMATWRLSQIDWQHKTEQSLYQLMPQRETKPEKKAPKNDASGNTPATPDPVR